jgi:VCBS repeat protein
MSRSIRSPRARVALLVVVALIVAAAAGAWLRQRRLSMAPPAGESSPSPPVAVIPRLQGTGWNEIDDPARDGWDSEVFAAKVGDRLKAVAKRILDPDGPAPPELAAADFASGSLRPERLERALEDGVLLVERARPGGAASGPERAHRGPGGFGEALRALALPFRGAAEARCEFKVFGVEKTGEWIVTRQYLALSGRTAEGFLEENSTWEARWAPGDEPRLLGVEVSSFERVRRTSPVPLYTDCTESVLGRNPSHHEQVLRGLNHWAERIQDDRFLSLLGTPGVAIGDVNGDGLDDLYLCQEGGLPNLLFLQEADGSARDASDASGADWIESTRSALLVDLDNDGDQDLAAAVLGAVVLAAGDGRGRFELKEVLPTTHDTMSLSAADADLDGDLDVYISAYKQDDLTKDAGVLSIGAAGGFIYHDAENGAPDVLFRNDIREAGGWVFRDVTVESGLDVNNRRFSFAAAWEDFDDDGDQDLYVANDFGRSVLYRNDTPRGGPARFREIAAAAGVENNASGMGVTWGDYDRDGRMDVHVSNMFSAAGSRVTRQALFKPDATEEVKARLRHFAEGDTLLRNAGGTFEDVSEAAGITMARWAWSSNFTDMQNDGWEDLLVANGYVTTEDPGDL